jgi:hypothetical protein
MPKYMMTVVRRDIYRACIIAPNVEAADRWYWNQPDIELEQYRSGSGLEKIKFEPESKASPNFAVNENGEVIPIPTAEPSPECKEKMALRQALYALLAKTELDTGDWFESENKQARKALGIHGEGHYHEKAKEAEAYSRFVERANAQFEEDAAVEPQDSTDGPDQEKE